MDKDLLYKRATAFAHALDKDDMAVAKGFLAGDCVYQLHDQILRGLEEIINSYQASSQKAKEHFDSVRYESAVVEIEDQQVTIEYLDELTVGTSSHQYRCRQRLTFSARAEIIKIDHIEMQGEREKLNRFLREHGINLH